MRSEKITGLMKLGYTYDAAEEMLDMMEEPIPSKQVPCEIYSRVVGYFRPVDQWNKGMQEQFKERLAYRLKNMMGGCR